MTKPHNQTLKLFLIKQVFTNEKCVNLKYVFCCEAAI